MQLRRGILIADRYRLVRPLGEGGMGVVWAATHVVTRRSVALKFLKAVAHDTMRRFLREARVASAVKHPNVVAIHDVVQQPDGPPVMVMDLLEGEPLSSLLARRGRLPVAEVARILLPVVSAVGTAHALGVVHRDLKPDNIFLVGERDAFSDVKVLDFGIAKLTATEGDAAQTGGLTTTGALMGTPYYMAPEQVYGERDVDHRADVWALGAVLYEALSGARPIDGDNIGQIFKAITLGTIPPLATRAPDVPHELASRVAAMLTRDKLARPADLRGIFDLLAQYTSQGAQSFGAAVPAPRSEIPPPLESAPPGGAGAAPTAPQISVRLPAAGGVDSVDSTVGLTQAIPLSGSARTVPLRTQRTGKGFAIGIATLAVAALSLVGIVAVRARAARTEAVASVSAAFVAPTSAPPDPPGAEAPSSAPTSTTASPPIASAPAPDRVKPQRSVPARGATPAPTPSPAATLPGGVHGENPY